MDHKRKASFTFTNGNVAVFPADEISIQDRPPHFLEVICGDKDPVYINPAHVLYSEFVEEA